MKFNKRKIGEALKNMRNSIGLTRTDLAKKLCVTEDTVKKWEQGKNTPKLTDLLSIAEVLNTNVSELIER